MTRIAVLKGGLSPEREISLITGAACAGALRENGYEVIELDVRRDVAARLLEIKPDVCFNALHGPLGEDGSIQGLLNILEIPYTHSGLTASCLAMDKAKSKLFAEYHGIPSPRGKVVDAEGFWSATPQAPYVLKPINDGSSINTFIVRDPSVDPFAKDCWPFGGEALLEELVQGKELTVTVLGDRPLTVTEIIPSAEFYDYHSKYVVGGSTHILPADIPSESFQKCLDAALKIHRALGCRGISRSDFIMDSSYEPNFLEINTQPGMTPTSLAPEQARAVGISFLALVDMLIKFARTD